MQGKYKDDIQEMKIIYAASIQVYTQKAITDKG